MLKLIPVFLLFSLNYAFADSDFGGPVDCHGIAEEDVHIVRQGCTSARSTKCFRKGLSILIRGDFKIPSLIRNMCKHSDSSWSRSLCYRSAIEASDLSAMKGLVRVCGSLSGTSERTKCYAKGLKADE